MKRIENTTSYKTILIPTLIIFKREYYEMDTVQDYFSRWINLETGKEMQCNRNFTGDDYVMFSEAYVLGREVEYLQNKELKRSFIVSADVEIDKDMGDAFNPFYDIIVTLEDGTRKSVYSMDFLTEVDGYTKSAHDIFVEILNDLM